MERAIEGSDEQPWKADVPKLVTDGIDTDVKSPQLSKQLFPTLVHTGNEIVGNELHI